MLRRNLIVVFKPIKSTSVILSELNHRLMNLGVSFRFVLSVGFSLPLACALRPKNRENRSF